MGAVLEAVLTPGELERLPDSAFAVPGKRLLPLHDRAHAELAWRMVDRTQGLTEEERREARRRIIAVLKSFGVDVSGYHIEEATSVFCEVTEAMPQAFADRREVEVTIIRPGLSENGLWYSQEVLREAVPLWEGAAAFCDHPGPLDLGRAGGRSIRDLVGVYHMARYAADPRNPGIRAALRFLPSAAWLYQLVEAVLGDRQAGKPVPKLGISADMVVRRAPLTKGERVLWEVVKIAQVTSGDVVFNPSAGGRFERILEGSHGNRWANGWDTSIGSIGTLKQEVYTMSEEKGRSGGHPEPQAETAPDGLKELVSQWQRELQAARRAREVLAQDLLKAKLQASGLPEAAQAQLQRQLEGRACEAEEMDKAIETMRGLLASLFQGQVVQGVGLGRPQAQVGLRPLDKMQVAMDRLFGIEPPDHLKGVPRLTGIREAYILITGDRFFTGKYNWEDSVVREANEITTSVMANVLGTSMNKRLVMDYKAQTRWWEPAVVRTSLNNMKQQERIALNDFAALATVAENAAYANLAWGDRKETYTPAKRGGLAYVTLETIINDDLRAVQQIPTKLAAAATVTINEFIAGRLTTNPTMSDTFPVFDATNHQGNSGTAALSSQALQDAISTMGKYTNSAGKRIGIKPRYILVPPDLMWAALVLLNSTLAPGTANNDINVLRGVVEVIVVPQFTDANDWYLMADPKEAEGLEVGFLNGREEPELLVQDNPTDGSVFTNDAITWKVRHIYGAGWLDYRAAYRSQVA